MLDIINNFKSDEKEAVHSGLLPAELDQRLRIFVRQENQLCGTQPDPHRLRTRKILWHRP